MVEGQTGGLTDMGWRFTSELASYQYKRLLKKMIDTILDTTTAAAAMNRKSDNCTSIAEH